jgi:hypothetical protein
MRKILYTQYYRCKQPERQVEIDRCLQINLNHPGLHKVVVLREADAPPIPKGSVPSEIIDFNDRLTYSSWMSLAKQENDAIALLVNSDIYLSEGAEYLDAVFNTPNAFMAMSRYNPIPGTEKFGLNSFPHWTQDVWGIRTDANISKSLLYASTFALGIPGCDNRIAYVMWSHGFEVKNPAYFVKTVHEHNELSRPYDTHGDRLYGGVSYVHLSLTPSEPSELEHTIWTRSEEIGGGILINQQSSGKGVRKFVDQKGSDVDLFENLQKFTGLSWMHQAKGSRHVRLATQHPLAGNPSHSSEHTLALPMTELIGSGLQLQLKPDEVLLGMCLRLPFASSAVYEILIQGRRGDESWQTVTPTNQIVDGKGKRNFLEDRNLWRNFDTFKLLIKPSEANSETWATNSFAELVLFCEKPQQVQPSHGASVSETKTTDLGIDTLSELGTPEHISRTSFQHDKVTEIHKFGTRFVVWSDAQYIYFQDRFWPTLARCNRGAYSDIELIKSEEALLAFGFLQPLLEWKQNQIATIKTYPGQSLFWQYPCRTEQDAYDVHNKLLGPQYEENAYHIYIGLPWATFIDMSLKGEEFPHTMLQSYSKRTEALRAELKRFGRKLRVHTVCQHIRWQKICNAISSIGITDLWISHKKKGKNQEGNLQLHAWTLYAPNDRDPERREGLTLLPIESRNIFASFTGAHMKHYISDVRLRMKELSDLEGYQVVIQEKWHFNDIVYSFQVYNDYKKKTTDSDAVITYNKLLSSTRFSLCPVGAGPNTLRLWESLAVGSIPVLLSDSHELPAIVRFAPGSNWRWEDALIFHPENELNQLDNRLKNIDVIEQNKRQQLCRSLYEASRSITCFGRVQVEVEPLPTEPLEPVSFDEQKLELFKPQQVRDPSSVINDFTGTSQLVNAIVPFTSSGSTRVIHCDKPELLIAVEIFCEGISIEDVQITLSYFTDIKCFEKLETPNMTQLSESLIRYDLVSPTWIAGIKADLKASDVNKAAAGHIQIIPIVDSESFSRTVREFDEKGILKPLSEANSTRKDDLFSSDQIASGGIINRLRKLASAIPAAKRDRLFPADFVWKNNLIGEEVKEGICMIVQVMNENENITKNIDNWLTLGFDELIILDWSSAPAVYSIPNIFKDPRVKIIRVGGQKKFLSTLAQNLASQLSRYSKIFSFNPDVEFRGDFFAAHPIKRGEFWLGDWRQARDGNESNLHGEIYYYVDDFMRVAGCDERIKSYSQIDTVLADRMFLSGLKKKIFDYTYFQHQPHGQKAPSQDGNGIHPIVAIYANRIMTASTPIWAPPVKTSSFKLVKSSLEGRQLLFSLGYCPPDATKNEHINQARLIVGGWHAPVDQLAKMSTNEIDALINKMQTEKTF